MHTAEVRFDGRRMGFIQVPDTEWGAAGLLQDPGGASDSKTRERVAIAKLMQLGLTCSAATHASYDVGVQVQGVRYRADLKTLYPAHGVAAADLGESLLELVDHEFEKEKRQGNKCLFDLSYLTSAVRDEIIGQIHNVYPDAMTLWYDAANSQVHFAYPQARKEHHIPA